MKKFIILAAVISAATVSRAAIFLWSTSDTLAGNLYDGTATKAAAGTAVYLFDAATLSQQAAYDAFKGGTLSGKLSNAAANTVLNSNSRITSTEVTYGSADTSSTMYWIALIGDDKLYISTTMNKAPQEVGGTALEWADVRTTSNNGVKESFAGAGVYGGAIPEPTSGVLLLLGMAGVALRRRRV